MSNAIEIKSLRKEYGKKVAVNDVTYEIEEGTLFGLLGVNGAGKTTTIKLLTGLAMPTAGTATVCEYDIVKEIVKVKECVNVSTQENAVSKNLTVRENLEFFGGIYGLNKEKAKKRADEMIAEFGLEEVENTRAKTLSGGWRRRLSIAMSLVTKPKVLFLDEPTLGLDVLARRELWKVIRNLKGQITIVLTTHYLEEAEALCDKIAVMAAGDIKALGTVDELKHMTNTDTLENAFVALVEGDDSAETLHNEEKN